MRVGIGGHELPATNPNMPSTAKVKRSVSGYWKRGTTEAIHIQLGEGTMNLDNVYFI